MKFGCSIKDINSISSNVLGEASQAMDSGVYLVQSVQRPTVPNSGVLVVLDSRATSRNPDT